MRFPVFFRSASIPAARYLAAAVVSAVMILQCHTDAMAAFDPALTREARNIGTVNSLLIQQHGEIIVEDYWGRASRNRDTNIKSASKSILSLLVGIAIDKGYLEGVEQPIGSFFKAYFDDNPDPAKESITIRDLLTMRAGLETTSFRNYGTWVTSRNWVRYTLDQPMEGTPGREMIYSTGSSHLLSAILTEATGMSTKAFADRYLFQPLDITVGGWDRDPQGIYMGGNNMALSSRDLLKIGELMMDMGIHEGEQLIPKQWILDSVNIYTKSNFNDNDFGYMWWRRVVAGHHVIFAWGSGGQYMMMLPELDAIVVVTSEIDTVQPERGTRRDIFRFLEEDIIPMLKTE